MFLLELNFSPTSTSPQLTPLMLLFLPVVCKLPHCSPYSLALQGSLYPLCSPHSRTNSALITSPLNMFQFWKSSRAGGFLDSSFQITSSPWFSTIPDSGIIRFGLTFRISWGKTVVTVSNHCLDLIQKTLSFAFSHNDISHKKPLKNLNFFLVN